MAIKKKERKRHNFQEYWDMIRTNLRIHGVEEAVEI
jgi:hypothetical protein